jgi:steroid 5-alpha reductase family enzyme
MFLFFTQNIPIFEVNFQTMLVTILILLFTLVVIPLATFYLGTPLSDLQYEILWDTGSIVLGVMVYTFVVGQLTRNNSQVDKLWSIVPIGYVWYMTWRGGMDERMVLMSVMATIWGIRLTYNFARRGAYSWKFWEGEEDYRWEILRKKKGFEKPWVWMLFNLFFICFYQNVLIFLFTLPILTCLYESAAPLGFLDYMLALIMLALIIIEFIADQQQYNFQTEKYRRKNAGEEMGLYAKGFVSTGLWKYMRHPNYAAEQSIWVVFYLFGVVVTGEWINWSMAGCMLLVILFKGSSDFSEAISFEKYPAYKNYQQSVPRFIPGLRFKSRKGV